MQRYVIKPQTAKKNQIIQTENSFSGFSFRYVDFKNKNFVLLGDKNILSKNIKGFEPGSKEYINFSDNYFIRISELGDSEFTFGVQEDTKKIRPVINTNKTKIISKGDICYQTASNVGNVCIYDGKKAFYNSHIRKLEFKKSKYYIFAILKSKFGKEQVDVAGSIKGVDNFREEYLLKTKIPFPTKNNNRDPHEVEELISLIVQNIINKEERIKEKTKLLDTEIEKELKNNQNSKNYSYSYPKISEVKKETRFDTGLYEKEFKKTDFLIRNYKNGFFQIPVENFKSGATPSIRIFNPKNKHFKWITPTHIRDEGFYEPNLTIDMPKKNNVNKDCVLIINRTSKGKKGEFVGISCFYDVAEYGKGQHNQGLYQVKEYDKQTSLFLVALLNSRVFRKICGNVTIGSKMKEMKSYDFSKLLYPNFSSNIKKKISEIYYNKISKNKNLNLKNYLDNEFKRNKELGIFQLNLEIFKLRQILEDLIHKIVMDEKIEIGFEY